MIDMGTAKFLTKVDGAYERTFTVVGTPHYTAPEVINQKGYSLSADYWSLGIMLFEVAVGYVPFGCDDVDVFQVYQRVLQEELVFPDYFNEEGTKAMIIQLLNRSPDARVGNSISSLKAHKWFDSIDWVSLTPLLGLKLTLLG